MVDFNNEQLRAIETIDNNVGVIAGAGTGKTALLTERFINIIENSTLTPQKALESIVAITFTKKATREMVDRITKRINELSEEGNDRFKGLDKFVPFMNISTIDSFCKKIIDENGFLIGLGANYEIIEPSEGMKLLDKVIAEVLNKNFSDKNFRQFLYVTELDKKENIIEVFREAYKNIVSKGYDFDRLLEKSFKDASESDTHLIEYLNEIDELVMKLKDIRVQKKDGKGTLAALHGSKSIFRYRFDDSRTKMLDKEELDDQSKVSELLTNIRSATNNLDMSDNTCDKISLSEKELAEKEISNIGEEILKLTEEQRLNFIIKLKPIYSTINNILKEIENRFRSFKLKELKLEFNDLLYYANIILENDNVRKRYQEKFQYFMIDEFQDTNLLQRNLFYKLASKNKLLDRKNFFVVGDPKQSIYGFRGSDLDVFYETIDDIEESGGEIIELVQNYRSTKELVSYANILFSEIMGEKYISLNANSKKTDKKVLRIDVQSNESIDEAEETAKYILKLKEEGRSFKDIAILFRSSGKLNELEYCLKKYNIPYINPKSKGFFDKREVLDLILFTRVLNSTDDSLSLYGLLRSDFFIISDEDLYNLSQKKGYNLWSKLTNYKGDVGEIIKAKYILEDVISRKDQESVYELIKDFVNKTNIYKLMSLTKRNEQILENIKKFEILAFQYPGDKNSVSDFLDYIKDLSDETVAEAEVNSGADLVNLLTIHSSKGLEFPVVILFDGNNPGKNDTDKILVNREIGYGIKLFDTDIIHSQVSDKNNNLKNEEIDRLLYVCVTRAEEEFVFTNRLESSNYGSALSNNKRLLKENIDYDIDIVENIELKSEVEENIKLKITTDESSLSKVKEIKKYKKDIRSSITGYNVYKSCPREYYYRYKLGIKNTEILDNRFENFDNQINSVTISRDEAAEFGTIVHSLIENFNNENFEEQLLDSIENSNIKDKERLKTRINKNLKTYQNNKISGESIYEFGFLYKLDEGMMTGSIDELVFTNDGVILIDFKTNNVKDNNHLEKLVNDYKPQIRLYSLAVEKLIGKKPKLSYIYFLDYDKIVEVPWDDKENKILLEELNNFLRFISYNDSIDRYEVTGDCFKCDYKTICNKE